MLESGKRSPPLEAVFTGRNNLAMSAATKLSELDLEKHDEPKDQATSALNDQAECCEILAENCKFDYERLAGEQAWRPPLTC